MTEFILSVEFLSGMLAGTVIGINMMFYLVMR